MNRGVITALLILFPLLINAQVGNYRNNFSIGGNAGYALSNVGFDPKVSQSLHGGITAGLSLRYVCEKYFNTICSIYGEINYVSAGWKQDIRTSSDKSVINVNGSIEKYSRTLNYLQIPVFAHLAWGREQDGFNFFVQAGPQIGILLNETTAKNYETPNLSKDGKTRIHARRKEIRLRYCSWFRCRMEYSPLRTFPHRGTLLLRLGQYIRQYKTRFLWEIQQQQYNCQNNISVRYNKK